jgi:ornithine carbamoyltransferase
MIRTFEQEIIDRFSKHSRVPVINGLTNEYHPCQILARTVPVSSGMLQLRSTSIPCAPRDAEDKS